MCIIRVVLIDFSFLFVIVEARLIFYLDSSQTKINLSLTPREDTPSFSLAINSSVEGKRPQAVSPWFLNHLPFIHLYAGFIPHNNPSSWFIDHASLGVVGYEI